MPEFVDETLARMREAYKQLPAEHKLVPAFQCKKCGAPANIQFGYKGWVWHCCELCRPTVTHNFSYEAWLREPQRKPLRDSRGVRYTRCERCRSYRCNCEVTSGHQLPRRMDSNAR